MASVTINDGVLDGVRRAPARVRHLTVDSALAPAVVALNQAGGTVPVNAARGNIFTVTLTASGWTVASPVNPASGQAIHIWLAQDSAGSRLVTWGAAYDFGASGTPTLSTGAGQVDIVGFVYNAGLAKWCFLGSALGN